MKKLVTLIAVLAMVGSAMAGSSDDFESYTAGTWSETEMIDAGWAYSDPTTDGQTIGTEYGRSGNGLRYYQTITGTYAAYASPQWGINTNGGRIDATNNLFSGYVNVESIDGWFSLTVKNNDDGACNRFEFGSNNNIAWRGDGANIDIGTWSADTWLQLEFEVDFANERSRARLDGGSWSAYKDYFSSRTASWMRVALESRQGILALDDFSVTPEPATIALLGFGGLALLRRKRA